MLNFMLDSELADVARATIERINSDHLTSEEHIERVVARLHVGWQAGDTIQSC